MDSIVKENKRKERRKRKEQKTEKALFQWKEANLLLEVSYKI